MWYMRVRRARGPGARNNLGGTAAHAHPLCAFNKFQYIYKKGSIKRWRRPIQPVFGCNYAARIGRPTRTKHRLLGAQTSSD